jgi:hypothetical protein
MVVQESQRAKRNIQDFLRLMLETGTISPHYLLKTRHNNCTV